MSAVIKSESFISIEDYWLANCWQKPSMNTLMVLFMQWWSE